MSHAFQAAQKIEEGLKDWDPAKDPNADVRPVNDLAKASRLNLRMHAGSR